MSALPASPAAPGTDWTPGRKLAAGVFVTVACAALAVTAMYLSGVLFLVLSKVSPSRAGPTSIVHYWQRYSGDAQLRRRLQLSIGVPAVGLLVLLPAAMLAAARPRRSLHGDARFASEAEIRRAGLMNDHGGPAIVLARRKGRLLTLPGQQSVLLAAPTRSGKGVGVVIPNLLHWPGSVVVLDIKGENYDVTAGWRAAIGQQVFAFSPFDEDARSHRWNPLSCVRTSALHRVGDLLALGQVLFPSALGGTTSEAFFNDQARNLFLGLGLLLLESPQLPRTIGEMLRQSSGQGLPLKEHLPALIQRRRDQGLPLSAPCTQALHRLLANSDNTLASVVASFNAPLVLFADAIVDAATSGDDFRLEDVRRRPMSIYVRIPPGRLADARPLLNLLFSQLVALNTRRLPQQDPTLRLQCLLVHDEFAALGRLEVVASAAAFLAGYNLRLLTVVQAMSQLDAVYGERQARSFATNHGLQILFAPREQRDAEEYSAMLGNFTARATSHGRSHSSAGAGHGSVSLNESEQRRALLLPQELKAMGSERVVLIPENCRPILADKIRYHRDSLFSGRLRPAPPVPMLAVPDGPAGSLGAPPDILARATAMAAHLDERVHESAPRFIAASRQPAVPRTGGSIEPLADADGVLIHEPAHGRDGPSPVGPCLSQ